MENASRDPESEFVHLLVNHQSMIRAFVISLLPGAPEVDDVIQNTNEVLWRKKDEFELGTNFKAWALSIARFQVMAQQQKVRRSKCVMLDDDVLDMLAEEASGLDEQNLNRKMADLQDCIGRLSIKDQELILHRYWKKAGLSDYARATKRSVGALRVALHRIRGSLKTCMEIKQSSVAGKVNS
ncbi:hypothetical protein Rhal01_01364 [Rubritalea halochordaticola]|uniref:RNA polymerase sigma-70 region 2 domain-containing protein n=1 Tax=Rubritalea halochordaticola TaxID=714537 RepID=A0ABP9UZS4_9BACT